MNKRPENERETLANDDLVPVAIAAELAGTTYAAIRNKLHYGRPTPFPVYKNPTNGRLYAKRSDAIAFTHKLLAECRVDVGGRTESGAE